MQHLTAREPIQPRARLGHPQGAEPQLGHGLERAERLQLQDFGAALEPLARGPGERPFRGPTLTPRVLAQCGQQAIGARRWRPARRARAARTPNS